jgi:hypothetical protein
MNDNKGFSVKYINMKVTKQIAKSLRAVYFGGNWTVSNLKDTVKDITWQQATTKVKELNTIVTLVYHMSYYVDVLSRVLEGHPLDAKDEYSFKHPIIQSQKDWETMLTKIFSNVEKLANLLEQTPDSKLWEDFINDKYGNYYRNLQGVIEHVHYHLGQINLIKKLV